MRTRLNLGFRRGLLMLAGAVTCLAAVPNPAQALNFVYVCLCCRPDGSIRYLAGWCNATCAELSIFTAVVGCDTLFTALAANPTSGVGDGYAPAFDRAVPLGSVVPAGTANPETRIVMGYYPLADEFHAGSYSTRVFAIQEGGSGQAVNRFAAIDIELGGLDPTAECVSTSSILGGQPIPSPFDNSPGPLVASGDVTIVVQTFRASAPNQAVDTRLIPITLSSLTFVDATPLPPMCIGDANRSGAVTFADVTSALANFTRTYAIGVLTPGDANGDRIVNFTDVTTILANFGAVCGGTP